MKGNLLRNRPLLGKIISLSSKSWGAKARVQTKLTKRIQTYTECESFCDGKELVKKLLMMDEAKNTTNGYGNP